MAGFSAIQSNLAGELGPERVTNARVSVEFFAHRRVETRAPASLHDR